MDSRLLPSTGWKRALLLVVLGAGTTVAVVLLIGNVAHYAKLSARLRDASAGWLVVCALGELLAYSGNIVSYQAMAQVSGGPRFPATLAVRVVGLSFGAFSLATSLGGLSVDFWALREAGEPPARASARIIALETLRWGILGLAACAAGALVLAGVWQRPPVAVPIIWIGVVTFCFAGGIWISTSGRRGRFIDAGGGLLRRALGVAVIALVYLRELASGSDGAAVRRGAVGGALLLWTGDLLCAWAALRAFGVSLGIGPLVLGYITGFVATAVPLPAGGSGGVDAALTGGFVLAGAPLSAALLAAVAFRVFNFWLPALAAMLSVLTARGLRRRLRELAQDRA